MKTNPTNPELSKPSPRLTRNQDFSLQQPHHTIRYSKVELYLTHSQKLSWKHHVLLEIYTLGINIEPPPTQLLTESSTTLSEKTAILQPIGKINKEKQPELAPGEHSSTQTPNPLALISKILPIHQIMAYRDIAKLEKFSSEKNNAYIWITEAEKAITTNNWNNNRTIQAFIIKQKDHKAAIERDYYTVVQILNQFVKELKSSLLQSMRLLHSTNLQEAVTLACNFESAEQETNYTQAVNLAINRTFDIDTKITQLSEKLTQKIEGFLAIITPDINNNRITSNNNNIGNPIPEINISTQNTLKTWYSNTSHLNINHLNIYNKYSIPSNHFKSTTSLHNHWFKQHSRTPATIRDQLTDFYSSTSLEGKDVGEISNLSRRKQINNIIPPAIITKDTTLAAIFLFDIDHLNTTSLFSGAAINQDKPITALYTDARVENIDINNTKTPIGKIDNFPFEINEIQISIKVLVMEVTQYQALVRNNWLAKAHAILD
ncbi:hypothetical protein G9A89_014080 [Geosiphon pyriformis]|nr:hypothetical protein G9A89_014080 [Geosiphon pyriformis]